MQAEAERKKRAQVLESEGDDCIVLSFFRLAFLILPLEKR
jgi:hypothetical protein